MRRLVLLATALVALVAAVPAEAAKCTKPSGLKVSRGAAAKATLKWRKPKKGSFRVLRNGHVVGQTKRHSMAVNVRPGRRVTLSVGIVRAGGKSPKCYAKITAKLATAGAIDAALTAPGQVRIEALADGAATIGWEKVAKAKRYRVFRDGAVVGETSGTTMKVRVAAGASATVQVAAVGTTGKVGPRSSALSVRTDRRAPGAPKGLQADAVGPFGVTLDWSAGAAGSAPLRGYRVTRNGQVLGQVPQTSFRATGLLPSTHYVFTVTAVDTQGLPSPAATVELDTPPPDPSTGATQAFLLATTSSSFADFRDHYQKVGVLYPTYYDCNRAHPAQIDGQDDPQVTGFAKARNVPVMPRYNCQNLTALRAVLNDPATRQAVISGLVGLVQANGYSGINLDIESGAPSDRASLTSFVASLADALHAVGARLSIDVSPKVKDVPNHPRSTFYDYNALSQSADIVVVMAWGLHWSTSGPGSLVDLTWLSQVAGYVRTVANPQKFVIGTPGYGFDWAAGGGISHPADPLDFSDIQALLASTGAQPARDPASAELHFTYTDASGTGHEVWYADATSIAAALNVARGNGLGFAFWRTGQEDVTTWDSL